jgi:hypothetical protein
MRRAILLLALSLAACGGAKKADPTPTATATAAKTATPAATSAKVAIDPQDQAACQALFARLQRVTVALGSASELLTKSLDKAQLSKQIGIEQEQIERSATLMDSAVVPKPLASANRELVAALREYAKGFAKARGPASQGDFQTAAAAMTDKATIAKILDSAKKIQDTCSS